MYKETCVDEKDKPELASEVAPFNDKHRNGHTENLECDYGPKTDG